MTYPILLTIHLFAALFFIGVVFFEVLMLEPLRAQMPREAMRQLESAVGARARKIMPWVLLCLYGAGIGMAWMAYGSLLADPLQHRFGLLLWIKIAFTTSVMGHFLTAMALQRRGKLGSRDSRIIHYSVFTHMVGIVMIAKWMFHLS
ncbi:hypothetical protein G7047_10285 [Diaphorobacter sp. HDW4A]|uniref:CopD family copper resistance protein n=1 Tax=Diaphorobacter sp. HDW4A TaxID=2714924 RepID=UPI00140E7877|nr:hypothetical protein [Diaphorobacter sp. HDW4A]QIL80246.1 hypothetical protein G7047_10285 [Diaphorobacter sp. HDW4A]